MFVPRCHSPGDFFYIFIVMNLTDILLEHQKSFHPVVNFSPVAYKIIQLDFTKNNIELSRVDLINTESFATYISNLLAKNNAVYGIGGYLENRVLYKRSSHFEGEQNRTIHLGIDIWGKERTNVYAPLNGIVHSLACNDNFGDYGATIILQHQLKGKIFHTLYGHLSRTDVESLKVGSAINAGECFAHFGNILENGSWPPHLHFQIIEDMQNKNGDYPGVCAINEIDYYRANCPNADFILNMIQYAISI